MNDQREENVFEWAAGETTLFTNWDINQPRSPVAMNQDCVRIYRNVSTFPRSQVPVNLDSVRLPPHSHMASN